MVHWPLRLVLICPLSYYMYLLLLLLLGDVWLNRHPEIMWNIPALMYLFLAPDLSCASKKGTAFNKAGIKYFHRLQDIM